MSLQRSSSRSGRADIQGLRAIAVVAVILDHLLGQPAGGFVGVDVFFVISGYLITGLLLREHARTGSISMRTFYARRVKRIVPAAVLVLLATIAAAWVLTPGARFMRTVVDSVWALLFSANWNLAIQGTDYFQQGALPSPVQHFWSLAVEEQFYLVWPWLLLGLLAVGTARFRWQARGHRIAAGALIGLLTAASFVWSLHDTAVDPDWAYFSTASRGWELGVGAILAVLAGRVRIPNSAVRALLAWIGLAGIVLAVVTTTEGGGFPAPAAALPVLSTALVLIAGEHGYQRFLLPLTSRPLQWLGDRSYSLYLWHFPVVVLLLAVLPAGDPRYVAVASALILLLSALCYRFVEDPIRRSSWLVPAKGARRPRGAARWRPHHTGLVALAAVVTVVLLVVGDQLRDQEQGVAARAAAFVPETSQQAQRVCLGADVIARSTDCTTHDFGGTVFPSVQAASADVAQQFACWAFPGQPMRTCSEGTGRTRVALVGDSHAADLIPALRTQVAARGWTLSTFVGDTCVPTTTAKSKCRGAHDAIVAATTRDRAFDVVIVAASRFQGATPAEYVPYFRSVLAAHARLVVVQDTPRVTQGTVLCTQRVGFDPRTSACTTPVRIADSPVDPLIAAAEAVRGAHLVDLKPWLCTPSSCSAVIGHVVVYRDDRGHLTTTYSKTLGPYLAAAISRT